MNCDKNLSFLEQVVVEIENQNQMPAQDFLKWIQHQGGYIHPAIDLFHDFGDGKRGVVAKKDIAEGEQLLLIPSHATLFWNSKNSEDSSEF